MTVRPHELMSVNNEHVHDLADALERYIDPKLEACAPDFNGKMARIDLQESVPLQVQEEIRKRYTAGEDSSGEPGWSTVTFRSAADQREGEAWYWIEFEV